MPESRRCFRRAARLAKRRKHRAREGQAARSTALKRSAFPFALLGMLAVVAIVALGGAADPATGRAGTRDWVTAHLVGGIGLAAAIAWCFRAQLGAIARQHRLIDEVMDAVRCERAARGLDVELVPQQTVAPPR